MYPIGQPLRNNSVAAVWRRVCGVTRFPQFGTFHRTLEHLLDPIDGETAAVLCRKESRVVVSAEV